VGSTHNLCNAVMHPSPKGICTSACSAPACRLQAWTVVGQLCALLPVRIVVPHSKPCFILFLTAFLLYAGCQAGQYLALGSCVPCQKGSYCLGGTAAESVSTPCGPNLDTINLGSKESKDCGRCMQLVIVTACQSQSK
jgi:hypothetical protein